eukprot:3725180-Pleurochrysis_carterae.AAC.1
MLPRLCVRRLSFARRRPFFAGQLGSFALAISSGAARHAEQPPRLRLAPRLTYEWPHVGSLLQHISIAIGLPARRALPLAA